jgi:hypothetical protein
MLHVVAWKWGAKFSPKFVNRLRAMLERNLHLPHQLVCVTDDAFGIDERVRCVKIPKRFTDTPRCRRRMQQYDRDFGDVIGAKRILSIDLDVVIVDDITPIVDRLESIVCWKVAYADVFSGSFVLFDNGALHGMWARFENDPVGFPREASPRGIGSDQAMLNFWLRGKDVPYWTERDGFVTYFGAGYEAFASHGVAPSNPRLPPGARIVVFGSDDIPALESGRFGFVERHWRE